MSEPILAEDSTITHLSPSLEGILKCLDKCVEQHDYLVALFIVFLAESGFYISSTDNSSYCQRLQSLHIPKNWRTETGIYELRFRLHHSPEVECKLVVIPSGETLIVNFCPLVSTKKAYSIAVESSKYVSTFSMDIHKRYRNIKEISHRFKDALATPVRTDILIKSGLVFPSLQGLPTEVKLKILGLLKVHELTRIALCSSEFHELCSVPQLWKKLLLKDFPRTVCKPSDNYKDRYCTLYKEAQRVRRNSLLRRISHRPIARLH